MGSSFGKVRKYNVNHSGDPTTYRYNSTLDEDGKYLDLSRTQVKNLRSFRKSTHQESTRFYNPKVKEDDPTMTIFSAAYPHQKQPEQCGFGVSEDLLIPSKFSFSNAKTKREPVAPRLYEFSEQQLREAIENVLRKPAHGSSLPSSTYGTIKPDSATDPNPKPHQKFYSAEDIHRLLRPLNVINSKLNAIHSYQKFLDQESHRHSKQNTISNPWTFQSIPHVCCNHKESSSGGHQIEITRPPPPYNSNHIKHATSYSSNYNHNISSENVQQSNPVFDSLSTTTEKYNTIHNDGRIPLHLRKEFNNISIYRKPPLEMQDHQTQPEKQESVMLSRTINDVIHRQRTDHTTINNNSKDIKHYKNYPEYLTRTAVFDQNAQLNSQLYTKFLSQNRYNISEENSWPPPFTYNSMRSTGYYQKY